MKTGFGTGRVSKFMDTLRKLYPNQRVGHSCHMTSSSLSCLARAARSCSRDCSTVFPLRPPMMYPLSLLCNCPISTVLVSWGIFKLFKTRRNEFGNILLPYCENWLQCPDSKYAGSFQYVENQWLLSPEPQYDVVQQWTSKLIYDGSQMSWKSRDGRLQASWDVTVSACLVSRRQTLQQYDTRTSRVENMDKCLDTALDLKPWCLIFAGSLSLCASLLLQNLC